MTKTVTHEQEPLLPGAHRVIRVLAPGEGPVCGALVVNEEDLAICVDVASLAGWQGWALAGADHIATPIDLVRRRDGQDVLLPWCTERITAFVARRHGVGEALTAGEVSTLVISLLRGLGEAATAESSLIGEWWLTATARPVFALGGGAAIESASAALIETLRSHATDRALSRLLGNIADGLGDLRRALHRCDLWESELLEHAAPRPLRAGLYAPERAAHVTVGGPREERALDPESPLFDLTGDREGGGARAMFEQLIPRIREVLDASRLRRGLRQLPVRRSRVQKGQKVQDATPQPRRWGKPLLVGGAAAAAVIAVGVFWPSGGDSSSGDAARADSSVGLSLDTSTAKEATATPQNAEPAPTPTPEPTAEAPTAQAPLAAVAGLVALSTSCAGGDAVSCESAWYPVRTSTESAVIRGGVEGVPTLIEDYGDLAAVRWESSDGADAQMLVLIRLNHRWRIQDVYDVADPPSQ